MGRFQNALWDFAASLMTVDALWPFWAVVLIFTLIGQFTSKRLFTRERAYKDWGKKWKHYFWFWMRETLIFHPILTGVLLGLVWQDPKHQGWHLAESMCFFATAGALSVFAWSLLKSALKKHGFDIRLPGDSEHPPSGV